MFFVHVSITLCFEILHYNYLFLCLSPNLSFSLADMDGVLSSASGKVLGYKMTVTVECLNKWINVYMTSLLPVLHWWAQSSHSLVSKGLPLTLFWNVSLLFLLWKSLLYSTPDKWVTPQLYWNFASTANSLFLKEGSMLKLFILFPSDNCHGLLAGVPAHIINRLQLVWNVVARIQFNTGSNKYTTPVFVSSKLEMENYY